MLIWRRSAFLRLLYDIVLEMVKTYKNFTVSMVKIKKYVKNYNQYIKNQKKSIKTTKFSLS